MSNNPRLSLEDRVRCVRYYSKYKIISNVQKAWRNDFGTEPPSRKTITQINKKFDETGSVFDLQRTGRPKKQDEELKNNIKMAIVQDPNRSLKSLSDEFQLNRTAVHRIKKASEDNKVKVVKCENRKLKDKITELRKRVDLLENSEATGDDLYNIDKKKNPNFYPSTSKKMSNSGSIQVQNQNQNQNQNPSYTFIPDNSIPTVQLIQTRTDEEADSNALDFREINLEEAFNNDNNTIHIIEVPEGGSIGIDEEIHQISSCPTHGTDNPSNECQMCNFFISS